MNDVKIDTWDSGSEIFCKHEQAKGICYCLTILCEGLDERALCGIKTDIRFTTMNLDSCIDAMKVLGRQNPINFVCLFRAFKEVFEAHSRIDLLIQAPILEEINNSEKLKHIYNTAAALSYILHDIKTLLEELIENSAPSEAA